MELIKERLQYLRIKNNVSKATLVKYLNIRRQTYYAYEDGKVIPSMDKIIKLADFYSVSLDFIVGRTEHMQPESSQFADIIHKLVDAGITVNKFKLILDFIIKFKTLD